jgi:hypothetical protein
MYAAIAAQSYEVRLVTQMVRLPIPTWEELEASRTYGSEFEKLEARQMFRVPYLMGWQENLARSGRSPPEASPSANIGTNIAATEANDASVDPWGLEQSSKFPELGCGFGADVARLRHVKVTRQAAIQWQTYDGFARICMSIGVQQLMLAMIYYLLGYLFVEVNCTGAAVSGVIGFTIISEMIFVRDTSLPVPSRRLAQTLLGIGPMAATVAAAHWGNDSTNVYKFWVVVAFLAHGAYFGLLAVHCKVRELSNGAWLPLAFRSVLYLDVFSWARGGAERRPAIGGGVSERIEAEGVAMSRPAVRSVQYDEHGRPIPVQVHEWAPSSTQDMRDIPGAPNTSRRHSSGEARFEDFYSNTSFLPPETQDEHLKGTDTEELWSDRLGPGDLPWRVFMVAIFVLVAVWLFAATYALHGAFTGFSWDLDNDKHWDIVNDRRKVVHPESYQPWNDEDGNAWMRKSKPKGANKHHAPVSLLSSYTLGTPQQVMLEWPHFGARPNRVSCDATGQTLVLSDRIALFSATVEKVSANEGRGRLRAFPQVFSCPALLGEGLDDVALACKSSSESETSDCDLLALHRHGRQITACALKRSLEASRSGFISTDTGGNTAQISHSWLENFHPSVDAAQGIARSQVEKPLSVSVNPRCTDKAGSQKLLCTVVGTSEGRVVQLGQRSNGNSLIPAEILHEEVTLAPKAHSASSIRAVSARYLGVLYDSGHSIRILDMSKGGLIAGSINLGLKKSAASFCAGGGNFFVLTEGSVPELWKVPIPSELLDAS